MESSGKQTWRSRLTLCLLLGLAGCSDQEIATYRVPKDPGAAAAEVVMEPGSGAAPPSHPAENTNDLPHGAFKVAPTGAGDEPSLHWQTPPEWEAQPVTAMRKGSYTVSRGGAAADLSITAFPGDVGGLTANLNRWRGQIGLPPLEGTALGANSETVDSHGLHFTVVDFAGPTSGGQKRILAALASWQGATWFFKLMGPEALVESEKPAFTAFLETVGPK